MRRDSLLFVGYTRHPQSDAVTAISVCLLCSSRGSREVRHWNDDTPLLSFADFVRERFDADWRAGRTTTPCFLGFCLPPLLRQTAVAAAQAGRPWPLDAWCRPDLIDWQTLLTTQERESVLDAGEWSGPGVRPFDDVRVALTLASIFGVFEYA